ncbi:hypothetical protein BDW22DRAFT_1304367, partial [Trametopsis cervina]
LGIRTQDCEYTKHDYAMYEQERDRILQSPRGRTALMMGGIVWRLAMESIGSDDVLRGPSGHHTKTDIVMTDGAPFIDDTLTEHELDIVCGVYRNLGSADKSWWPKHNTWSGSGMHVGYWTDKDERWYLGRLHAIKSGNEGPKHARKW